MSSSRLDLACNARFFFVVPAVHNTNKERLATALCYIECPLVEWYERVLGSVSQDKVVNESFLSPTSRNQLKANEHRCYTLQPFPSWQVLVQ
jgi:hypothetical protein